MNQNTKQRIVGTVVLIAIALIFLPLIFDGGGTYQRTLESRIPTPPIVEVMANPIPIRPTIEADSVISLQDPATDLPPAEETLLDAIVIEETVLENSEPVVAQDNEIQAPVLDVTGLPVAWSIRLGAFASTSNAENLKQQLLTAGYRAYTRDIASDQRPLVAVFVGPQVEREKAEQLKQELKGRYQLAGDIVRYEVESFPQGH